MLTVSNQDDKYCEGFCDRTEKLSDILNGAVEITCESFQ